MQALTVTNQVAGQNFERDFPAEFGVMGKIDLAHPALAEQGNNFVLADALTGWKCYRFVHGICGRPFQLPGDQADRAVLAVDSLVRGENMWPGQASQ